MIFGVNHWLALTGVITFPFLAQISPSQVDSTLSGLKKAQELTDRGVWIGLLFVVITLCGVFLRNAAKEVEKARESAGKREEKFLSKEDKFIEVVSSFQQAVAQTQIESSRVIERNTVMFERTREALKDVEVSVEKIERRLEMSHKS
jgi:Na+/phosphate symporter